MIISSYIKEILSNKKYIIFTEKINLKNNKISCNNMVKY